MNFNINLIPRRKSFFKKMIILILFTFICFFIKENVFALSVPKFLDEFDNDYVDCSSDICLNDDIHSFKAFMEYYGIFMHRYVLLTSNVDGTNKTIYLFSELPYFDCNSEKCFIYNSSNKNLRDFSKFYWITRSDGPSTDGYYYWDTYIKTTKPSEGYIFFSSKFKDGFESNFDILDVEGNVIYNATTNETIDWTDSEDISPENLNWFEKLIKYIVSIPNNIVDGIKNLFIPGDELEGFFEEEYEYIKQQLGFLTYPIEVIIDFANRFYNINDTNTAIFKIPKLEIFDKTIYEGTEFDLMSIVNKNQNIRYLYNIYKTVVSGFIVLWLVQLAIKKEHEIFGGGIE